MLCHNVVLKNKRDRAKLLFFEKIFIDVGKKQFTIHWEMINRKIRIEFFKDYIQTKIDLLITCTDLYYIGFRFNSS